MVDLCSCLGGVEPVYGTPLRSGTILASADAPSLSIDPRLAGFRAELRELGVFCSVAAAAGPSGASHQVFAGGFQSFYFFYY